MAKRPWKETKVSIRLPIDVLAEYDAEAARFYKSTRDYLRDLLIERLRSPQPAAAAPTSLHSSRVSRSGYKGVYAYGKRWEAVVHVGKQRRRLGVYDDPETAARAYDDYLTSQAGSPNAAVNFPTLVDKASAANGPFIEQFAANGKVNDLEWQQWQQSKVPGAAFAGPLPVLPDGVRIDGSTPLIDRPAKSLTRRDSVPDLPTAPPARPDPEPAEPDEN